MRYISLFSGVEAASVAWRDLPEFEPVAFCEIDKFPSAVLAYRFPDVPNLGDITKVDWKEVLKEHGSIDLIVGGSPCQSFSIAAGANRTSLDGKSNLMFEYIRAIREIRPTWLLWENVPGVLNVRDNAFAQLLEELSIIGYGLAWRCLDAQFFNLAQRRKRVFLVGCLRNGGASAAVLFNSESVSGFTQSPQRKRQELADVHGKSADPTIQVMTNTTCKAPVDVDMSGTLLAGGGEPPIAIVPKAYMLKMRGGKDTYTKRDGTTGTAGKGALVGDDCAFTLSCTQDQTLFAYDEIAKDYVARKLTPREEERLQGFPDDWTKIPYRGKSADECPDAPRYKAMGNSMAVPVMRWIGERIEQVDRLQKEMQKIS